MPYLTFNDVLEKAGITNLGHEPGEGNMADEMVLLSLLRIIAYPDVLLKFRKTFRYVHFSGRPPFAILRRFSHKG